MSKWLNFHTLNSSMKVTIDSNPREVQAVHDWSRLGEENTHINGHSLKEIMECLPKQKNFKAKIKSEGSEPSKILSEALEDIKNFFSETILHDFKGDKTKPVDELIKSFHQGGLLYPASAAINSVFESTGISPNATDNKKLINIQTTASGFRIQEITSYTECVVNPDATEEIQNLSKNNLFQPDNGQPFVLEAQVTLDVAFTEQGNLKFDVLNHGISYNNKDIKKVADNRNWVTKFVDAIKRLFGYNSVKDLSAKPDSKLEVQEENTINPGFKP